ncbi:MAG: CHASE domain-containing protein [Akkermansiaceae bacterium]|nr:CHASE domain-containing protein [Akkermansiaceae bacterium]
MIRILSIRGVTWVVFVISLFATAVVCRQAWRRQADLAQVRFTIEQARFGADAEHFRNTMKERLFRYVQILQGTGGLFAASQAVEFGEFSAYVDSLELKVKYPGIKAVGYIEKVEHANGEGFMRDAGHAAGEPQRPFRIWPAGDRQEYLVLRFVEPLVTETNHSALGYDLGSEPVRRTAAMAACDNATATLSANLELVQAPGQPAAILFLPIYQQGVEPATKDERRASLQGWVSVGFLIEDMMQGVQQLINGDLGYEIFDGTAPSPDQLLCRSDFNEPLTAADPLTQTTTETVFGHPWTVRLHTPSAATHGSGMLSVGLVGTGGLCMSLLIFGVAHSMATTGRRAVELATGMTTEIRRQEEALRASEERLGMIIEGSNDGVWDWNVTTGEVYFSPRWKSMLGYDDHEIENNFTAWEALLHPDEKARALRVLNDYFGGKAPVYQLEHRLRHNDGSYRWILARGVVSRDPHGRPLRMAGSHVDLTDLKQAEWELRQANEELHSSQIQLRATLDELRNSHQELERTQLELIQAAKLESVGTLAAGVAHEVKNPLQIMVMGLDYLDLRFNSADETTHTTLNDMRDAVMRADAISRELLQFSKATGFSPIPSDLEGVLERSLWLIRADFNNPRVTLIKNLTGNLPLVLVDIQKIQQVFINLTLNALQAMDHEGILTISTACGRLERFLPSRPAINAGLQPADEVVVLRLVDTGPGIPAANLPQIFDPFFTTKGVGSGTGLGLSVVKKIIDLHGAVIHFQNAAQGGLEVTLAFAAGPQSADRAIFAEAI